MTSHMPATYEMDSVTHLRALIDDAFMVSRTIPFPVQRSESPTVVDLTTLTISDGCIALTEGMALYGS
jgi:hypothetical protein